LKVLFDTSVLVAGMVQSHDSHSIAHEWLSRAKHKEFDFFVSVHSLLECYAVLTSMPLSPPISPDTAHRLVKENVRSQASVVNHDGDDYARVLSQLSEAEITGGAVYDALIATAAQNESVDRLLSLNVKDFARFDWLDEVEVHHP